jgi:PAS domain S-box-containing protein
MRARTSPERYAHLPWLIVTMTVVALAIGTIAARYVESRLVASRGESLALAAAEIAHKLDLLLAERHSDVRALAQIPLLRGRDVAAKNAYLDSLRTISPLYLLLGVTDAQGRFVAATDRACIGMDMSRSPWFQAARGTRQVYVGDVEPFEEAGGMDAISFTAPITGPRGEFLGTVTTRVGLPILEDVVARTLRAFQAREGFQGSLEYKFMTSTGAVFIDSDLLHKGNVNLKRMGLPSALLSETDRPGYFEEEHSQRHVPVVTGYARTQGVGGLPGLKWTVLLRTDKDTLVAPIRSVLWKLAAAWVLVWLPMLAFVLWSMTRLKKEHEQAEEERAHAAIAEANYRQLVEQAKDIIYRTDAQGRFTFVNPVATRLLGYTPQELLGRRFVELIRPDAREAAERFYGRQFVRKSPNTYHEFPALTKDGREIWFGQNVQVLLTDDCIVGFHAVTRDITERKRAEEALRESERRLALVLEATNEGLWDWNIKTGAVYYSPHWIESLGYTPDEVPPHVTFWEGIVHPDDMLRVREALQAHFEGRTATYVCENRLRRKDGSWRWNLDRGKVVEWDSDGKPLRMVGTDTDITERKREENTLQALLEGTASVTGEQFFPALVRVLARALGVRHAFVTELLGDEQPRLRMLAIWTDDRLGNPTEYDLARTPCETVIKLGEAYYQHSVQELFPEDKDLVAFGAESYLGIALVDSPGKTIGHLCILDDKPLPDEHYIAPLLKVFASRAAAELERKRAEEKLLLSREIISNAHDPISVMDLQGRFTYQNPAHASLVGFSDGELLGKTPALFLGDEAFASICQQLARTQSYRGGVVARTKGGALKDLDLSVFTIRDAANKPTCFVAIKRDITERKRAEEVQEQLVAELAESRNRFEMFFRQTPSAIAITTVKEGRFLDLNKQAEVLTGYSREELIGRTTVEMNLYVDPAERSDIVQRLKKTGLLTDLERQIRTKSGEIRTAVFSLVPIQMGSEPCLLSIAHDITERKRAESLLTGEKRVLEMISSGETLATVLESIARLVEEQRPGMLCSILLLGKSRKTLHHGAAPSLPPSYVQAIDGIAIGPTVGSCGTAAFLEKTVIVSDISSDPLWAMYRDLALPHGFRACWSMPIFSSDKLVLGTFAQYHRAPQSPTDDDLRLVERFCDLAGIAIERARAEEVLREANQSLRTLSRQLLQVQEDDRRAIARDLHDEIGQSLTAIKLNVERAQRASDRAARDRIMKDCLQITEGVLNQVRNLSLDLHPSILDDLGLAYALKWYADRQAERAGLNIEVAADLSLPRLSHDIEIGCFRIAQEALTNVVRHAKARRASVTLKRGTTTVELRVQDDGIGFVVDTVPSAATGAASVGLASMQERARLLGGEVRVKSVLRQGTEVIATLPLPSAPSTDTPREQVSRP